MTQRKKRILSAVLAAALLAGGLWYTRPRTVADMVGTELSGISIAVSRQTGDLIEVEETRQASYPLGHEDYEAVTALLEGLRFRRTIFRDAAYQLNDLLGQHGMKEIRAGDYRGYFAFFTGEDHDFVLDLGFWIDEWSLHQEDSFHRLTLVGGQETAVALHDALWELLPEEAP